MNNNYRGQAPCVNNGVRIVKKKCVVCVLIYLLVVFFGITASAFSYVEMPLEQIETYKNNVDVSLIGTPISPEPFCCFAVSEQGRIAIGIDNGSDKKVVVLNEQGDFLYAYSFTNYGTFGVGWEQENVVIFLVRSDIAATFNENAELQSVKMIDDSLGSNAYWNETVFAKQKEHGNKTYKMTSPVGFNLFREAAVLHRVSGDGEIEVLYDATSSWRTGMIVCAVVLVIIAVVFIAVFKPMFKKFMQFIKQQKYVG